MEYTAYNFVEITQKGEQLWLMLEHNGPVYVAEGSTVLLLGKKVNPLILELGTQDKFTGQVVRL